MKANIFVKNLNENSAVKRILEKLAEIKDLTEVNVDRELSRISFIYHSDEAAIRVIRMLDLLGYPGTLPYSGKLKKQNT